MPPGPRNAFGVERHREPVRPVAGKSENGFHRALRWPPCRKRSRRSTAKSSRKPRESRPCAALPAVTLVSNPVRWQRSAGPGARQSQTHNSPSKTSGKPMRMRNGQPSILHSSRSPRCNKSGTPYLTIRALPPLLPARTPRLSQCGVESGHRSKQPPSRTEKRIFTRRNRRCRGCDAVVAVSVHRLSLVAVSALAEPPPPRHRALDNPRPW